MLIMLKCVMILIIASSDNNSDPQTSINDMQVRQWQEKRPGMAGRLATSPHANCHTSAICRALTVYVVNVGYWN